MDDVAIKWWIRCLKGSSVYSRYVEAVRTGDAEGQQKLSQEWPSLRDIYSDFGDVRLVKTLRAFRLWASTRSHLFRNRHVVKFIIDQAECKPRRDMLYMEIELTDDVDKLIAEVDTAIRDVYYLHYHSMMYGAKMLPEHPTPKYMLHTGGEKISANILGSIRKAFYVAELKQSLEAVSGRKITQTELILASKLDPKNPFKWTLDPAEEAAINKDGASQVYVNTDELTLIKRHLKAHTAYTHNVLHGRFPDHS